MISWQAEIPEAPMTYFKRSQAKYVKKPYLCWLSAPSCTHVPELSVTTYNGKPDEFPSIESHTNRPDRSLEGQLSTAMMEVWVQQSASKGSTTTA